MTTLTRALLSALLLFTVAAPAAAYELPVVDETTPACPPVEMVDGVAVIPEGAPADCVYIQALTETPVVQLPGGEPRAEPMPINLSFGDCAPELAVAVAAGETPIAPAPCLLPDGTLYELAARGTMPNERGDGDETDWSAMDEQWMADYVAALEPCPEGLDPNAVDATVTTCRLPDGSVLGPLPLFAAAPGDIVEEGVVDDIATTTALEPCPEGLDPNAVDATVTTCRLPDGSVLGPMPLFAAAPGDIVEEGVVDGIATTTGATDENPMTLWFLAGGVAALGAAIAFMRTRRSTR